jgi:2,4-dienoyl-CoA reductase-like NADH-dependent reductase (Old Yellow Enzyme family)/NADPH-dependent 2,4-dienoyl-CoA reductase/sulfur reductase-like enzyme
VREPRRLDHLLSPGRIGSLELRNRIVMSPMGSNLAEPDGHLGERIVRYYEERAKGGAGLLIVGVAAIAYPAGACNPNQVAISDDAFLPGLGELARRVHAHGAKVAVQLQHAGKVAVRDIAAGRPLWVPSIPTFKAGDLADELSPDERERFIGDLRRPGAKLLYHEMTPEDVAQLVERFAEAADRARRAGFDAVELHAGHGYILSSFLSPASNRRDDDYGGSLENRARFLVETIRALKARVGGDFPVWCRIDSKEFRTEGGIAAADAQRTAQLAEAAGADAIHVSAYADPTSGVAFTDAPLVHRPGGYVELARGIKQRVSVPVIAVGRIEPALGDALIAAGGADFIAMARKLLADPELPNKLADGRPEDVRPCIYCYSCVGSIFLNESTRCAVNPATGRESACSIEAAPRSRRVLVVGGGPAGLEAARVAALRGHDVTLCEKADRLGGTLHFASLVCAENGVLARWLETQVRKLPVEVRLGCEVTPGLVAELAPDVVLLAVGARRTAPPIEGVDRPNVWSGDDLRSLLLGGADAAVLGKLTLAQRLVLRAGDLLDAGARPALTRELSRRWMPLGRRVAIVGGGLVGIELAEFLGERGREVSVFEASGTFAVQMAPPRRWRALHRLRELGVALHRNARVDAVDDAGVRFVDGDERRTAAADSVILAAGTRTDRRLADAIAGLVAEVHAIGDCEAIGYIAGAIEAGARVARTI